MDIEELKKTIAAAEDAGLRAAEGFATLAGKKGDDYITAMSEYKKLKTAADAAEKLAREARKTISTIERSQARAEQKTAEKAAAAKEKADARARAAKARADASAVPDDVARPVSAIAELGYEDALDRTFLAHSAVSLIFTASGSTYSPVDVAAMQCAPTDIGNADRFLIRNANLYLNCPVKSPSTLFWDGRRFESIDSTPARFAVAVQKTCVAITKEANIATDVGQHIGFEGQIELREWATASQMSNRIEAVKKIVNDRIYVSPKALNAGVNELCVANGMLNLRTGAMRPHSAADLNTKITDIPYDPKATCPTWLDYLQRALKGNQEVIDYVQRAIGYTLTGRTDDQIFFICDGSGSTGKSTFINTMQRLMGDYYCKVATRTFLEGGFKKSASDATPDLVKLPGARGVFCSEAKPDDFFDLERIKEFTGDTQMNVRALFKAEESFVPVGKLWMFLNDLPQFKNTGDGSMLRRIVRIRFNQIFANKGEQHWVPGAMAKMPNLAKRLEKEMPGILAWAVEGAKAYYANRGMGEMPEVCKVASKQYADDNDLLAGFVADAIEIVDGAFLTAAEAQDAYKIWCAHNSTEAMKTDTFRKKFADRFKDRKGQETSGRRARGFHGLAIAAAATATVVEVVKRQKWVLEFKGEIQARYHVAGPRELPDHLAEEVIGSAGETPEVRTSIRTAYGDLKRVA